MGLDVDEWRLLAHRILLPRKSWPYPEGKRKRRRLQVDLLGRLHHLLRSLPLLRLLRLQLVRPPHQREVWHHRGAYLHPRHVHARDEDRREGGRREEEYR